MVKLRKGLFYGPQWFVKPLAAPNNSKSVIFPYWQKKVPFTDSAAFVVIFQLDVHGSVAMRPRFPSDVIENSPLMSFMPSMPFPEALE